MVLAETENVIPFENFSASLLVCFCTSTSTKLVQSNRKQHLFFNKLTSSLNVKFYHKFCVVVSACKEAVLVPPGPPLAAPAPEPSARPAGDLCVQRPDDAAVSSSQPPSPHAPPEPDTHTQKALSITVQ